MLKFLVFADLHYKKGMYAVKISDMEKILERANENQVNFMIHAGDFCNDYIGSPELINTYLNNQYEIPVYGVYGNHELESENNSMEVVTPLLTNDKDVVWGTKDGKIGDGSIGYYYFEKDGYRIVCTDSNYSFNEELKQWEHNKTASWGAPEGNKNPNSLGPEQLDWLERVLIDAAQKSISCIVIGHVSFSNLWYKSSDTDAVQKIYKKVNEMTPKTVIININGHYHTNHIELHENIVYFDVNTAINGSWVPKEKHHYREDQTFILEEYDKNGYQTSTKEIPLTGLWQSINTHYFEEPLSAIVEITEDGVISIKGTTTTWRYDVVPNNPNSACMPQISDGRFILK